jgi:hypothetical protein
MERRKNELEDDSRRRPWRSLEWTRNFLGQGGEYKAENGEKRRMELKISGKAGKEEGEGMR